MSLSSFLDRAPAEIIRFYREVGRSQALYFEATGEEHFRVGVRKGIPENLRRPLEDIAMKDASAASETFSLGEMFRTGVKTFRLTAEQCEALEETELTLDTTDYHQPFPCLVVDLPRDYSSNRVVPGTWGEQHEPGFLVICHLEDMRAIIFTAGMQKDQKMCSSLTWVMRLNPGKRVEDCWNRLSWREEYGSPMTEEEASLSSALIRLGLNVCLVADSYGTRRMHDQTILSRIQKAEKHLKKGRDPEAAQDERARIPDLLTFDQEIVLYHREASPGLPGSIGVGHASPHVHWRRGHWRLQRHGPGLSLVKRIRIAPTLVGARGDTDINVTYRLS